MEIIVILVFGIFVLWLFAYMWQGVIETLFDIDSALLGWVASVVMAVFLVWLIRTVNNHYDKKAEKLPESQRWKVLVRQSLAWFGICLVGLVLFASYEEFKLEKGMHYYNVGVGQRTWNEDVDEDSLNLYLDSSDSQPLPTTPNSSKPLPATSNSSSSTRKHRGTSPDDGMFGFDYYDDEDDEYHMERNQSDPYPNERDW